MKNSIGDERIIDALYRASRAGASRWTCGCAHLRCAPGVPGLSENSADRDPAAAS
ncbi:hypothetical protein FAM14222_002359 [Propionibacterium freudenreichii]|uniref:hypothetical protein n=1 Tax=Propionibacterium freudenreichii TaxID=1744 RepID=UPI00254ADABF|nr:hypothetical protein [Propionibacterium freudenreichii]MDK9593940.1 hypothetical protein [Propionibacterium freudenreichii]